MIVFVRYNLGTGVPVELQEEASVSDLKEVVGSQQGVRPDLLRVLFAGRELRNTSTLQESDLPEQSTVHVVLPPSDSPSSQLLLPQQRLARGSGEQLDLTRSLPSTSSGLAVILEGGQTGWGGGAAEEVQAAEVTGESVVYPV
ncbi:hypothetical protein PBY51_015533 [Eleginops maclovinus]|uniref:Ubiquitin-like domain-containing protein n=1 Tax=Eleginops maclovinus TaxID=56733 RepID=A0AAN8AC17_ELEMC|nr:hypothetical protein PBY51_015533 [Eleginops maclovinus]